MIWGIPISGNLHLASSSSKFWSDQKWLHDHQSARFFHKFPAGSSCCALLGPCLLPGKRITSENKCFWVKYSNSLTWIKSIWGRFPLLINHHSQWGRSEVVIVYSDVWIRNDVMAIDSHPPPTSLISQVYLFQLSNQLSLGSHHTHPRCIHGKAGRRSLRNRPASFGRESYPEQTVPEWLREAALLCIKTPQCAHKSDINRKRSQCAQTNN